MFKYKQNCQYETELSLNKSPVQNEYIFTHMHFTHIVIILLFKVIILNRHSCSIDYAPQFKNENEVFVKRRTPSD